MKLEAILCALLLLSEAQGATQILMEVKPVGGATPEDIQSDINSGFSPPPQTVSELAYPVSADYLIHERLTDADIAKLGQDHPRVRLHQFLVLDYALVADMDAVLSQVRTLPYALQAYEDQWVDFSAVPIDLLFSEQGWPEDWQWGMNRLNLVNAWDGATGGAYIGLVDTGIQVTHEDLVANFRSHFSYNSVLNQFGNVDEHQSVVNPPRLCDGAVNGKHCGHGTHAAGVMAARANNTDQNGNPIGVAGACPQCSIMVGAMREAANNASEAITILVESGVEVLNFSWFLNAHADCPSDPLAVSDDICLALQLAHDHDVVMVAASGNEHDTKPYINFPARDWRALAVAAIDFYGNKPSFSQEGPQQAVAAPGFEVLSTFYEDQTWNGDAAWSCGDIFSAIPKYGPCTGTSMASPHIAGLAGLARSAHPLLSKFEVGTALLESASNWPSHDNALGYGLPDADKLIKRVLGSAGHQPLRNRLTPLLSLYLGNVDDLPAADDHFHTIVPQMAAAACYGTMQPRPVGVKLAYKLDPTAPQVVGYSDNPFSFCGTARADVFVATTPNNPFNADQPLIPIYRYSFNDGANNSDHTYTTSEGERQHLLDIGYKYDGIEGYVFSRLHYTELTKPTGTVMLLRRYNPVTDDHAIFPDTKLPQMQLAGYTVVAGSVPDGDKLGYAYPNHDTDLDGLIDGFELFIGTNPNSQHSDCDLVPDGEELPLAWPLPSGDPAYPQNTWSLANQTLTTADSHYACVQITAGNNYRIGPGGNLTIGAGQLIEFAPGFSVAQGGRLGASISPLP